MSDELNAFITRMERTERDQGPLSDTTIAVKDNISTAGVRTTCASTMLESYVPPYDATVIDRILAAGGTIVGKTNMDEFGMGSTTETSAFGPTLNPVDPAYVAGGSSGGSAAAVATGAADLALGSDTGGSVRNPAAFCGVVGIKPTYGLVSRYGLIAYAHSLEQIGPIARTVEDAATLLDVISGPDARDARCVDAAEDSAYAEAADGDVTGLDIGVPSQLIDGAEAGVVSTFRAALDRLETHGATVHSLALPSLEHAVAAYYVIAMSEASSNLARFDGIRYGHRVETSGDWNEAFAHTRREGFGEEVIRRILLGTFALSEGYHEQYYEQAQDARAWVTQEFSAAFEQVDIIASPTMPRVPFEIGEAELDPLRVYLADANTVPVNLADLPAISVPVGHTDGLPVGAQLIAPRFEESRLIRAASGVEHACA